ncbi:MAG: IS1634 family transposase [Eggerthellaceae bacterium]|nr:IS1634 family transposase [Eggerthellaceae bacterium]
MAVVHQKDNRTGITYAYEATYVWNKEKQQSRAKRTLIGRVNPETGEVTPTDGRMKRASAEKPKKQPPKQGPEPLPEHRRLFYGATYLLDMIGEKTGVAEDLRRCFPNEYEQILSIAYYLLLEDKNPLYRFEKWSSTHRHPFEKDITSQRSSELFMGITEDAVQKFFRLQGRRRMDDEHWAYDTTSFSSFSETLKQVQYGYNKEDDRLPQFNLALVFGQRSGLPFYYRKLAGNIPDVKTVKTLLSDFEGIGLRKVKLVMDKGFFSIDNINGLMKERLKFLISVKTSLSLVRKELDRVYDDFRTFEHYNEDYQLYSTTVTCDWAYSQKRHYKGDTLEGKRRVYIHLYYNIDRAAEDQKNFDRRLMGLKQEILSGKRVPEHEGQYKKYFLIKETPVRGIRVTVNEDAVTKAKRYYGFFALLSNEKMGSIEALELYRNKDVTEKAFGDLKERLNMRRTLVSSEQGLNGKLFVEFIALIYLSYLKKQMQQAHLFKDYTMTGLLDKLDVIECFLHPGHKLHIGEILEKQKLIYAALDIPPPSSS